MSCQKLCDLKEWDAKESAEVLYRVQQEYFVHLIVDNLPVATQFLMPDTNVMQYEPGFRLGYLDKNNKNKGYINNHLKFILSYHILDESVSNQKDSNPIYRVVGFRVETSSVSTDSSEFFGDDNKFCKIKDGHNPQQINGTSGPTRVQFSYSVHWEESDILWASRWDIYLTMADVQIHWFSIVNSVVVVFFLSGIITMIIIRTLRRDIARYNTDQDLEESIEETGWKLVHGDIFRPPANPRLFSAVVGSGVQVCLWSLCRFASFSASFVAEETYVISALSDLLHDVRGELLRHAWDALAGIAWRSPHRRHLPVRVHGARGRVLRWPPLQVPSRERVEASGVPDSHAVPWRDLLAWLFHQLVHLGQEV